MCSRNLDTGWCIGKRLIDIAGSFGTNGSSTPAATSVKGLGFGYAPSDTTGVMAAKANSTNSPITTTPGVVRSTTGTYVVTVEDTFRDLNVLSCDLQVASASANWAQPGPVASLAAATAAPNFTLFVINSSGATQDIASGASSRVHFFAQFSDSTVQFGKP